jgi:class 3 adenylate cyclase/tetratricopeptide (TPR) repeat protein
MLSDARFCSSCGARITPVVVAEERKLVTVVFCDLVGSTPLSEALDPETLRSVMLRYFAAMRGQIESFGGTVEKFIGDAVMAVFGIPAMREDDARRAAAASLGMLDALAVLNAELEPSLGVRLRVRIGVHSGQAVTSSDVSIRQSLVSGDTVNIAARLEQNAAEGQILIGPLTREAIGPAARVEPVGPLALKGKTAPLITFRLLGLGDDEPDHRRRFDLPFVGRTRELAELDAALSAVISMREPLLLTVCGEAGIGKTRLLRAWLDRVDRPFTHAEGRCRPFGVSGSLAPLAEAIQRLLATPDGQRIRHIEAAALAVLDIALLRDGTPGPSVESTYAALVRVLGGVSYGHPVVLTIDDCQWASQLLLDILERLAASAGCAAVLFVCVTRLELLDQRPGWGAGSAGPLVLSGLSAAESELLASALVEVEAHTGPAKNTARVLEMSGGNPFHLEQLFTAMSEADHPDGLPHSLQSLLGARIDSLDAADRVTLDLAAVFGREFTPELVKALADIGPEARPGGQLAKAAAGTEGDPVRVALARLHRRRLVAPAASQPSGAAQLRFSNGLLHEATYQAMTKRTRAERHERAAVILSGLDAGFAAPTVADHLEQAYRYRLALGLLDEATEALRRRAAAMLAAAGRKAFVRSDISWAAVLLERAVDLFTVGESGWSSAARQFGEVQIASGRAEEGRALLRAVLETSADPVETAHARIGLALVEATAPASVAAVAAQTLATFEAAGDDLGMARARIRLAQERQLRGRHVDAGELLDRALNHALRCAAEPEVALALGAVGISLWRGPVPVSEAVARCRELLVDHGPARPVVQVTLSCPLAVLLALDERWEEARACLAEARRSAEELGYAESDVVIPVFMAIVESLAGRTGPALDLLDGAARQARRLGATGQLSAITRDAARLLLDAGRTADAEKCLASVVDSADLLRSDSADLDGMRSRVAAAHGHAEQAVDLAERATATATATDSPLVQAVAALDKAMSLRHLGRPAPAADAAAAAYQLFVAKGHLPGMRCAAETRLGAAREAGQLSDTEVEPSEGNEA